MSIEQIYQTLTHILNITSKAALILFLAVGVSYFIYYIYRSRIKAYENAITARTITARTITTQCIDRSALIQVRSNAIHTTREE